MVENTEANDEFIKNEKLYFLHIHSACGGHFDDFSALFY